MKLVLEKDLQASVEVNGNSFLPIEDCALYQATEDNVIYVFLRSKSTPEKEVKIKIVNNKQR